ncbi:SPOR domain-containing protein [Kordiimonas pumila]|uniref:SPOR domain-containing protein n=1 Tax=Kordiimonas pumila TaxID=2161677 RepID=A0ABV7D342_9PROT|nr:SPOR domain-containing protein [Kordiimonas pumila]
MNERDDHTGITGGKDIPPWLQPVPEEEPNVTFWQARKTVIISASAAVVLLVLFVSVLVFLYDGSGAEPPRHVVAPSEPLREKPDDPGGLQVEYQDKEVFSRIDGTEDHSQVTLGPQAEEPVELPEEPEETASASQDTSPTTDEVVNSVLADMKQSAPTTAEKPEKSITVADEPKAAAPKPKPAASKPTYRIQLGAYGSEETAEKAWRAIKNKFSAQLNDKAPSYEKVSSGDRTLYRLRVGPIENRAAADQVCLSLRAGEQACIVVNP